jgi:hypothetical protein
MKTFTYSMWLIWYIQMHVFLFFQYDLSPVRIVIVMVWMCFHLCVCLTLTQAEIESVFNAERDKRDQK